MKRLKGPELKLSELKVPPFLSDLYWDLRDRRLLPLAALVVVAIVAVPFLLGGKSERHPVPVPVTVGTPSAGGGGSGGPKLVAVKAAPGLRNYHKRLGHRSPNNRQHARQQISPHHKRAPAIKNNIDLIPRADYRRS